LRPSPLPPKPVPGRGPEHGHGGGLPVLASRAQTGRKAGCRQDQSQLRLGAKWGRPLGHWSTEKTMSVPVFSSGCPAAQSPILWTDPNLRFRLFRFRICVGGALPAERDPFSHPSGSSAWMKPMFLNLNFEPKGAAPDDSWFPAPSGSVFLVHRSFTPAAPNWQAAVRTGLAPNPGNPGSRKRSVPVRVHSIP